MNLWYLVSLAVTILLFIGGCLLVKAILAWMALTPPSVDKGAKIVLGLIAIVIVICFITGTLPLIPIHGGGSR